VEGGNIHNDWWRFEQEPGNIHNDDKSGDAADHYVMYDEDFRLASEINQNAHRFSIEWSRIEPEEDRWDLEELQHYRNVLGSLKRHGMKPMVTLFHFTLPLWVADQGGWENRKTIEDFTDYAEFVAHHLGEDVDLWVTVNEPSIYGVFSYAAGLWPPKVRDTDRALRVMANLLKAHAQAYRTIHRVDRHDADLDGEPARVGLAKAIAILRPYCVFNPLDHMVAFYQDRVFNWNPLESGISGIIDLDIPGAAGVHEIYPPLMDTYDFIGVNYYTRWMVKSHGVENLVSNPRSEHTDLEWEIYPEGIYRVLMRVREYGKPIYITENGIADSEGSKRPRFIIDHLYRIWRAIEDGVHVEGYFHWSLMDNFEWAEGYRGRFGLYRVDFESPGKERTLTEGGGVLSAIAGSNGITKEILEGVGGY
jgi:beta-glucosidase